MLGWGTDRHRAVRVIPPSCLLVHNNGRLLEGPRGRMHNSRTRYALRLQLGAENRLADVSVVFAGFYAQSLRCPLLCRRNAVWVYPHGMMPYWSCCHGPCSVVKRILLCSASGRHRGLCCAAEELGTTSLPQRVQR